MLFKFLKLQIKTEYDNLATKTVPVLVSDLVRGLNCKLNDVYHCPIYRVDITTTNSLYSLSTRRKSLVIRYEKLQQANSL